MWEVMLILEAGGGQQERLKYTSSSNTSTRATLRSSGNGLEIDAALAQRGLYQVHQCYNWCISAKVCF